MCPMSAAPVIWKVKQKAGVLGEGRVEVTLPASLCYGIYFGHILVAMGSLSVTAKLSTAEVSPTLSLPSLNPSPPRGCGLRP